MNDVGVLLVEIQDCPLCDVVFRFPAAFFLAVTFPINQKFADGVTSSFACVNLEELFNLIGWALLSFDRRRRLLVPFRDRIFLVMMKARHMESGVDK